MSILKFFSSANYLPVNLCVARELGLETAVLLGELVSEHEFWESQGKLRADGYFYATVEKIEARTTLSKRKQLAAVEKLKAFTKRRRKAPSFRYGDIRRYLTVRYC